MVSKEFVRALPVLLTQGLKVRRTALRLPEAVDVTGQVGEGPDPLRVVVIGDSVAAGVGIQSHRATIAGLLAARLAGDRPVAWHVVARSGSTAGEVRSLVTTQDLDGTHCVVVSVGVNDTKDMHSDERFRAELGGLLDDVRRAAPDARVVLLGIPPMDVFPLLPGALARLLGARSRRLDAVAAAAAAERGVHHLPIVIDPRLTEAFAEDGFHPSTEGHKAIATRIHEWLEANDV